LVCFALCLTVAALWLRSYLPETLLWESDAGRLLIIGLPQGHAAVHDYRDKRRLGEYLEDLTNPRFFATPMAEHRFLGFYYAHGDPGWSGHFHMVGVPYWFLFAVVVVPTVVLVRRRRLATRRRAGNLCPVCGYDCRATPERCPECGSVPAS